MLECALPWGALLQLPKLATPCSCKYHQDNNRNMEKHFSFVF